jgi:hypothetical protein
MTSVRIITVALVLISLDCSDIFPVPVIAVFTKYDQFKLNVKMKLEDDEDDNAGSNAGSEAECLFQANYLHQLGENLGFVRLEREILRSWSAFSC